MEDGRIVTTWKRREVGRPGDRMQGSIDSDRRRDHMQQHTGQHVLSAAFIELYQIPTVSFHMGDDYCSIDLATPSLSTPQIDWEQRSAPTRLCLRTVQ
jgi:alanyl-tRNA synthetase